jgi:hypothetical protein
MRKNSRKPLEEMGAGDRLPDEVVDEVLAEGLTSQGGR